MAESTVPRREGWAPPVAVWTVLTAGLGVLQALAPRGASTTDGGWSASRAVEGWVQFDGPEYLDIALHGYERRQLVWFPVYPLAIRAVHAVGGSPAVIAVAISALAGLASLLLCWRWLLRQDLSRGARYTALAVMAVYPYGWFLYGGVYADSVFLAFTLGAFLLAERHRTLAAGLVAAVATAARPSGTAVVVALLVLVLERDGVLTVRDPEGAGLAARLGIPTRLDRSRLRASSFAPLLGLGGLVTFATWQWVEWGSPVRFVTEEANYHDTGDATFLKRQFFDAWYDHAFDGRHLATTTGQAVLLLIVLMSVPAVGRRFGWGYGVYVLLLAAFPAVTVSTFMGVGRYLLPAFPCFALAGAWLAERRLARVLWLVASASLIVVMTYGFARSWYLT